MPFIISSMTGGYPQRFAINQQLALIAEKLKIALALGSLRPLLEDDTLINQYDLKHLAPSVPVLGNIGILQINSNNIEKLKDLYYKLRLDGIFLHVNIIQELIQETDHDFLNNLWDKLELALTHLPKPLLIKEVGFGLTPDFIKRLDPSLVSWIDMAGTGGTNWASIEISFKPSKSVFKDLLSLGIPTPVSVALGAKIFPNVIASGGIRSSADVFKSLALGAKMIGLAYPIIKLLIKNGSEKVIKYLKSLKTGLIHLMFLTNSKTISDIRKTSPIILSQYLNYLISQWSK